MPLVLVLRGFFFLPLLGLGGGVSTLVVSFLSSFDSSELEFEDSELDSLPGDCFGVMAEMSSCSNLFL